MIKTDPLYYFYMVYKFQSIQLAADAIPIGATAVSSAIHKLEKEWEIKLVERTYHGIEITPAGKKIAEASKVLFEDMERIERIIMAESANCHQINNTVGKLKLFTSRSIWQSKSEMIYSFAKQSGVELALPDNNQDNAHILNIVNNDKMTVLMNYFTEPAEDLIKEFPNVKYEKTTALRPSVLAAKNTRWIPPEVTSLTPEEAGKLPLLRFTEGYDHAFSIFEMLEQAGPLNIVENLSSIHVLQNSVWYDNGVTVGAVSGKEEDYRVIPIRTDLRISTVVCYNKDIPKGYLCFAKELAKQLL